ncbi:MAG: Fur family transcriptional regulator [Egibacteraceae bacterium]
MSELLDRLRRRGWRLTAQRRVIAEVLAGEHVHLSADEVLARARRRLPEMSKATVYNTLNELVTMGEVLEVTGGACPRRYDPNATEPHQHLLCDLCGQLRDVVPSGQDVLALSSDQRYGYELSHAEIIFHGLCPRCQGA